MEAGRWPGGSPLAGPGVRRLAGGPARRAKARRAARVEGRGGGRSCDLAARLLSPSSMPPSRRRKTRVGASAVRAAPTGPRSPRAAACVQRCARLSPAASRSSFTNIIGCVAYRARGMGSKVISPRSSPNACPSYASTCRSSTLHYLGGGYHIHPAFWPCRQDAAEVIARGLPVRNRASGAGRDVHLRLLL